MNIDMRTLAAEIDQLKAAVQADQIFLMIISGYLKKIGFIDRQFLDGLVNDYKTHNPDNEHTRRVVSLLEQRFDTILPKP